MRIELGVAMIAIVSAAAVFADEYIPPVVGGRTYVQHLAEESKARHPEIQSIVVSGVRDGTKDNVILGSTLGATSVFTKVPAGDAKDSAAPSQDGKQFVVREAFLSSSGHRLGIIEVSFASQGGKDSASMQAIAKSVQTELKSATLSSKNAIDPYPYDAAYSPNTYAQSITEKMVHAHPDLIVIMIHATPPWKDQERCHWIQHWPLRQGSGRG